MNRRLILALLPFAAGANANCQTDPPEIGDIGPDSALVCEGLENRFPGTALAVDGRSIHSPTEVTVAATVDGRPIILDYTLTGFSWNLDDPGTRTADTVVPPPDPTIGY